jgi:hypothetical protein
LEPTQTSHQSKLLAGQGRHCLRLSQIFVKIRIIIIKIWLWCFSLLLLVLFFPLSNQKSFQKSKNSFSESKRDF